MTEKGPSSGKRPKHEYPGKLIVLEGTDGVGRTTQAQLLQSWLNIEGYGVTRTDWKSSQLMTRVIDKAKEKNALNTITFSLLYATDLADRLHNIIIPALKAGHIVITNRYFYTALARDVVRGADPSWVRELYSFAVEPDLVVYLKMPLEPLLRRIITTRGGLDFYESGRDIGMSNDLYQSFKLYQSQILFEYERMAEEYNFQTIAADDPVEVVQKTLRKELATILSDRKLHTSV
ncbi:MAG: Thymidylate kinase [Cyanobacteriota bacterium erpe_2018_sw_21hr_WHONDRS-SW48-000092_B_bin.40]|jgi:dTMP kinase|nr:Thymidylate kinase [Cyanobacteriota bacterium erpe_2018_sw_21hr_WHONDRS-SW48-000092_B_bin.40]